MASPSASRAVAASTVSLVVFGLCIVPFYLHRGRAFDGFAAFALGLGLCVSFVLHLVFFGIAAARHGRTAIGSVLLAFLLFPLASIVGLVLMAWAADEPRDAAGGHA